MNTYDKKKNKQFRNYTYCFGFNNHSFIDFSWDMREPPVSKKYEMIIIIKKLLTNSIKYGIINKGKIEMGL